MFCSTQYLKADNQPWFKSAHVGKFLDLKHINTSLEGLGKGEICVRNEFEAIYRSTGPKDQRNKTGVFLSVYGVMHVTVNSRKEVGKELTKWLLQEVLPRGSNKLLEERDTQLARS